MCIRDRTPTFYYLSKGIGRPGLKANQEPDKWNHSTVAKILSLQEYCGDVINFKTYSKSYKHKKRIANSEENMAIFRDVHEAVIDRVDWEKVQQKRGKVRKRRKRDGGQDVYKRQDYTHFWFPAPEVVYISEYKPSRAHPERRWRYAKCFLCILVA